MSHIINLNDANYTVRYCRFSFELNCFIQIIRIFNMMNNLLFIRISVFRTFFFMYVPGLWVILFLMSHTWFLAYKEEVHIAAYDGQRECFSKTGARAFWESVTIERLIHESIHSRLETRERNKKKTKENTRGTISRIHTNRKKNLNDMMREEISENEGMIHNVLIISHRFF